LTILKWYGAEKYELDDAISMTESGYLIKPSKDRFGTYVELVNKKWTTTFTSE
jgi:hypothetical protein